LQRVSIAASSVLPAKGCCPVKHMPFGVLKFHVDGFTGSIGVSAALLRMKAGLNKYACVLWNNSGCELHCTCLVSNATCILPTLSGQTV
jgi:hypothetical protein